MVFRSADDAGGIAGADAARINGLRDIGVAEAAADGELPKVRRDDALGDVEIPDIEDNAVAKVVGVRLGSDGLTAKEARGEDKVVGADRGGDVNDAFAGPLVIVPPANTTALH